MFTAERPQGRAPLGQPSHRRPERGGSFTPQERAEWIARENCERLPHFNLDGGCD